VAHGASIFGKPTLNRSSLRTVSDRRYGDAVALRDTKHNERANGAMYMAGFVIECLLKAQLLVEYPWLRTAQQHTLATDEARRVWGLCYRLHDLDEIYANLPKLQERLNRLGAGRVGRPTTQMSRICGTWTIFARYSPRGATIAEASDFIDSVKELRRYL
jgi:hypothetical protein